MTFIAAPFHDSLPGLTTPPFTITFTYEDNGDCALLKELVDYLL